MMTPPLIIVHRRNRVAQLAGLPLPCWIEIDVDLRDGVPFLSHDPVEESAERLDAFLPQARKRGVTGFVFDCKREGVEDSVYTILEKLKITNFFFLNEMEIRSDILFAASDRHRAAIRIWQYRGAADIIRYVGEMKSTKQNFPAWIWVDSWHRELPKDIGKAFVPLTKVEAQQLKQLGVKLCICSPELYSHDYGKTYSVDELQMIYRGIVRYRKSLMQTGILADAICTKFPQLWAEDIDSLLNAKILNA